MELATGLLVGYIALCTVGYTYFAARAWCERRATKALTHNVPHVFEAAALAERVDWSPDDLVFTVDERELLSQAQTIIDDVMACRKIGSPEREKMKGLHGELEALINPVDVDGRYWPTEDVQDYGPTIEAIRSLATDGPSKP